MNGRPFPPRAVVWNSRKGLEIGLCLVLEQVSNIQAGESVGCAPWVATPSSVAPLGLHLAVVGVIRAFTLPSVVLSAPQVDRRALGDGKGLRAAPGSVTGMQTLQDPQVHYLETQ